MKKQAVNPYLPPWEYIPDGEPYVFDGRVYVYGSHDSYNGFVFCMGDYMGWSAPEDDLGDWRCEGVIYPRDADPMNADGSMCLFAPDVTRGPDGRYYLYYVLDHASVVSVAVCDKPAGRYRFLGYVRDRDGIRLGERPGDEPQFDPGVLTEGSRTYLYTGFCSPGDKSRHGAMASVLGPDMLTLEEGPVFVVPGCEYAQNTGFEEHAFFEAPSIRKRGETYYLVYSSTAMHELCYAVSSHPLRGFRYGGVIVSNCDLRADGREPAGKIMAYGGNNHGSIVEILDKWYIFYHRQTNGTWFSRQGCIEPIRFLPDGSIPQAELTSNGPSGRPLRGEGEYPAYIACHLYTDEGMSMYAGSPRQPRVMQDGCDNAPGDSYIGDIRDGTTAGFRYFDCKGVRGLRIRTRAYMQGVFEVRLAWDGETLARIAVRNSNVWLESTAEVSIPDGIQSLYFTYRGTGEHIQMRSFAFIV